MKTFFYHVHISDGAISSHIPMQLRRVECADRLHFMNKLNRWNRLSMENRQGYVYVAVSDGDMNVGAADEYVVPLVSPDIYLQVADSR